MSFKKNGWDNTSTPPILKDGNITGEPADIFCVYPDTAEKEAIVVNQLLDSESLPLDMTIQRYGLEYYPKDFQSIVTMHWNTSLKQLETVKDADAYEYNLIEEIHLRDTAANRIESVLAAYRPFNGYNRLDFLRADTEFVELPMVRDGDLVTLDTSSFANEKTLEIQLCITVTNKTDPLTLTAVACATRDQIRELAELDPSEPVQFEYV